MRIAFNSILFFIPIFLRNLAESFESRLTRQSTSSGAANDAGDGGAAEGFDDVSTTLLTNLARS